MAEVPTSVLNARSGGVDEVAVLARGLVVAVDLGFAKSRASCGIAWRLADGTENAKDLQFAACVQKTYELISGVDRATLILEAPMSARFGPEGNPRDRGSFELKELISKSPQGSRKIQTRYWYTGPGAATCLAAMFFFQRLSSLLRGTKPEIVLYEGFLSFKCGGTKHKEDARRLLSTFITNAKPIAVTRESEDTVIVIASMFTAGGEPSPPLIIKPPDQDLSYCG